MYSFKGGGKREKIYELEGKHSKLEVKP